MEQDHIRSLSRAVALALAATALAVTGIYAPLAQASMVSTAGQTLTSPTGAEGMLTEEDNDIPVCC
ncbi:hypothetical protein ABK046_40220 [Streptomyces caeruleatus]